MQFRTTVKARKNHLREGKTVKARKKHLREGTAKLLILGSRGVGE